MNYQIKSDESDLYKLFSDFVTAGLHGRSSDALDLIEEPYIGVGMGEQGIVKNKAQAELILRDGYRPAPGAKIEFEIRDLTINFMGTDAAFLTGEIIVTNTPLNGKSLRSGLAQTIGACRKQNRWKISFTHCSPTILTAESVESYPIRFLDNTISTLKANLEADTHTQRDALTGILNREGFDRCVSKQMADYNPDYNTALFMIDLDDFKQINDHLGHQIGDQVLCQVAESLSHTFLENDTVARIGGDEFMVLLTGNFTVKLLENKAAELLDAVHIHVGESQQLPVSVSIGISYGHDRVTFDKLYRIADIALYTAKKEGKCRYHLINSDTNVQQGYSGSGTNLLSLQTLLEYTDGKDISQSKTPYEAILENIPGGVVMYEFTDTAIKITHCNEWFRRLVGCTKDELETLEAEDALVFVHPDNLPIMLEVFRRIREENLDQIDLNLRLLCKDGMAKLVDIHGSVIERTQQKVTMYVIYTESINVRT